MKKAVKFHALMSLAVLGVGMMVTGANLPLSSRKIRRGHDPGPLRCLWRPAALRSMSIMTAWSRAQPPSTGNAQQFIPTNIGQISNSLIPGKKLIKLSSGNDVIQWRPSSPTDKAFLHRCHHYCLEASQSSRHQGHSGCRRQDQDGRIHEGVDLSDLPQPLVDIAHNPGNQLTTIPHRHLRSRRR